MLDVLRHRPVDGPPFPPRLRAGRAQGEYEGHQRPARHGDPPSAPASHGPSRGAQAVREAVEHCLRSAHGGRADAYRDGLSASGEVRMSVVVQRMVDASAAGVLARVSPLAQRAGRRVSNSASSAWSSGVSSTLCTEAKNCDRSPAPWCS
ncbi:hypothetical protein F0U62_03910 [Cystobacter fuscus]|nr:hypothetical protein F0U62_03910 [Cystobacter fuscus]